LLLGELPNWRGDFRRREKGSRCLIEQRLEDVMISPVNQNDFGIASSQRSRGCEPSEPPAHNHNARRLVFVGLHVESVLTWAGYVQYIIHYSSRVSRGERMRRLHPDGTPTP
jgi:hypothetical protein